MKQRVAHATGARGTSRRVSEKEGEGGRPRANRMKMEQMMRVKKTNRLARCAEEGKRNGPNEREGLDASGPRVCPRIRNPRLHTWARSLDLGAPSLQCSTIEIASETRPMAFVKKAAHTRYLCRPDRSAFRHSSPSGPGSRRLRSGSRCEVNDWHEEKFDCEGSSLQKEHKATEQAQIYQKGRRRRSQVAHTDIEAWK